MGLKLAIISLIFVSFIFGQASELSVQTYKIVKPKIYNIKLTSPPHRSTLSSGVVTFEWDIPQKYQKKKLVLELVDLDKDKKITIKAKNNSKRYSVEPGRYKWRVVDTKSKIDSRWRTFKIITFSYREPSSVPKKVKTSQQQIQPSKTQVFRDKFIH